ncbi:winged helix-turn-helix domain-containing protein [Pantoea sp.]|uniref:transcriptional regulator n=1 Tax=Pantoea sp. TaxID=69393 RepID=UPI0031D70728
MHPILIGHLLTLDPRTRVLQRVSDDRKVNLGNSACLCLEGLIAAQQEVVSQEELINLGWRQIGMEVTSSSLRVAINQLRRALLSLKVDKEIMIITVPRTGYRLVIPHAAVETQPVAAPPAVEAAEDSVIEVPESEPVSAVVEPEPMSESNASGKWRIGLLLMVLFALAGAGSSWGLGWWMKHAAVAVNYRLYNTADNQVPAGAKVFVDSAVNPNAVQIDKTLKQWAVHAPEANNYSYLYVNVGHDDDYTGLFACKQPLGETQSECSSYVFSTH